jgi:hypothetical protein
MTTGDHELAKSLSGNYERRAIYFADSDCVEYVREDTFTVYERVDHFLTLIFDETKLDLIGFKLKGFKHVFDAHLKPIFKLHDNQFVGIVSAIEAVCTELGDELFADDKRARAYKAALKLATTDNVQVTYETLKAAA